MKKQLRTILAALAISSMMATTAFGAEMVYINDYEGWELNDSITAANQVSVTSVTKTDSTTFPIWAPHIIVRCLSSSLQKTICWYSR